MKFTPVWILLLAAALLGACLFNPLGSGADPELEMEDVVGDPPNPPSTSGEGTGQVDYHYSVDNEVLVFELEPVIGLTIDKNEDGITYDVHGMGETHVQFQMQASAEGGRCWVICDVDLRFAADGGVFKSDVGRCEIPMNITFVPDQETWEIGGDCRPEALEQIDCAALSLVMADPGEYTFAHGFEELDLPSGTGATRRATLKNLQLPAELSSYCTW
jgi:hypothetical protein